MSSDTLPDLHELANWLRQHDPHAQYHLDLLKQVAAAMSGEARGPRQRLALRLERWRYQHLQERGGWVSPEDHALLAALEEMAVRLGDGQELPPRGVAQAVELEAAEPESIREALELLDSRQPLSQVAERARRLTEASFAASGSSEAGVSCRRRMLLYAPLYVSSHCVNSCTYCGFRYPLEIPRRHLSLDEAREQLSLLHPWGFGHLLIVGGDYPQLTTTDYYCRIAAMLGELGIVPAVEIAPQGAAGYGQLVRAGVRGVTLYQETYDRERYAEYHVRGPKSHYDWRLEGPDRAAEAGIERLGLGVLLGLGDLRQELRCLMRHGAYLRQRFPECTLAFSLPRIHEAPAGFQVPQPISDDRLIRAYCALRVAFPTAELVLSTRELPALRNRLAAICITQLSAGSSTTPGGYAECPPTAGQQFPVADRRDPAEVAEWLERAGFHVAWTLD